MLAASQQDTETVIAPSMLDVITRNKEYLTKKYGADAYNVMRGYYSLDSAYSLFGDVDQSYFPETASLIEFINNADAYISENGYQQFTDEFINYANKAWNELSQAGDIYNDAATDVSYELVQMIPGADKIGYSLSLEDQIRQLLGVVPAGYDISQLFEGLPLLEDSTLPEEWTNENVIEALVKVTGQLEADSYEVFLAAYENEYAHLITYNPEMEDTEAAKIAFNNAQEAAMIYEAIYYYADMDERDTYIAQVREEARLGFEKAEELGITVSFEAAINLYRHYKNLDDNQIEGAEANRQAAREQYGEGYAAIALPVPEADASSPIEMPYVVGSYDASTFFLNDDAQSNVSFVVEEINDIVARQRYRKSIGLETESSEMQKLYNLGLHVLADGIENTQEGDYVTLTENVRKEIEKDSYQFYASELTAEVNGMVLDGFNQYMEEEDYVETAEKYSHKENVDSTETYAQLSDEQLASGDYNEYREILLSINNIELGTITVDDDGNTHYTAGKTIHGDYITASYYNFITEDERNMVRYLYGKSELEELETYLSLIEPVLVQREDAADKEYIQKLIDQEGPWGEILAGMKSIANTLLAPLTYIDTLSHAIYNEEIDPYSAMQRFGRNATEYGDLALQNTEGIGRFFGEALLSIGQNLPMLLAGPTGALVWMGLSAAGVDAAQQTLMGASAWEAFGHGTAMGLVEALTEKLPMDELFKLGKKGVKSFAEGLAQVGRLAGINMTEEAIAAAAQNFLDMAISGEDSAYWQRVNELKAGGLTQEQATATANFEFYIYQPIYAAAQGAVSGIVMGSGAAVLGSVFGYNQNTQTDGRQTAQNNPGRDYINPVEQQKSGNGRNNADFSGAERQNGQNGDIRGNIDLSTPEGQQQTYTADASETNNGGLQADIIQALTDQDIADRIRKNVNDPATAHMVQTALTEGMSALTNIETRIKADSRNVNHQGIDIETSHNAYMDFASGRGDMGTAAMAMAGDIGKAVATGQLSMGEVNQLQGILTGLTGDAGLAAAYMESVIDGAEESGYNGTEHAGKTNANENNREILARNRERGRAFERMQVKLFDSIADNVVEQVTIRTNQGTKIRVDAIGTDIETGDIIIQEYKSSETAPLTPNQDKGFPELEDSGGVVVGQGKGIFSGGKTIPPIKVDVIRPKHKE